MRLFQIIVKDETGSPIESGWVALDEIPTSSGTDRPFTGAALFDHVLQEGLDRGVHETAREAAEEISR